MDSSNKSAYQKVLKSQLDFFNSNATKSIQFRIAQLQKLKKILKANESLLDEAIYKDFKKGSFENYTTELSLVYHEIELGIENVADWSTRSRVDTNLANMPGSSYILPEPLGVCLVIGASNYPYLLSLHPLVSAILAGNTVVLKPSEVAANSSAILAKLINANFDSNYLHVIEGGVEETTLLLKEKFDKIFYTGSSNVGRIILHAAAEHLTPVTLELGGKSPTFVLKDAKLKIAAKRIVWAKFLNCGQTCVAPDYLLVEKGIKQQLIAEIKNQIVKIHGVNPENSEAFARIINKRHFDRIVKLIDSKKVVFGGDANPENLYIAPTILDNVTFEDSVMQEEIFGPILPIIEFEDLNWAIKMVKAHPKPLALYAFTSSTKKSDRIVKEISFGGGVINDAVMHLANVNLPFGGVGNSGMGNYHGKFGFDTFSHFKSVLERSTLIEPSVKYPPYSGWKKRLLKWLME